MAGKFILRAEQSASGFRNDRLTESAAFVVVDILVSNREAEGYVRIKVRKKMKKKGKFGVGRFGRFWNQPRLQFSLSEGLFRPRPQQRPRRKPQTLDSPIFCLVSVDGVAASVP